MKKFSLLALTTLIIFSCTKESGLGTFNMDYETEFTIPKAFPVNSPVPLFTPAIETRHQQEFSNNNTRADLVRELKLNQIQLTITDPEAQTFRFLQSVHLYLVAEGLPEILIAKKEDIPSNIGNELYLEIEDRDLAEYIKKETFTLKATTVSREILTREITVSTYLDFRVKAKLLK